MSDQALTDLFKAVKKIALNGQKKAEMVNQLKDAFRAHFVMFGDLKSSYAISYCFFDRKALTYCYKCNLIFQDKISTSKNSIWYKKYEIELTNRIKLETRLKKFEESYNILEKEAEKKFEDLLEERESQKSKADTSEPHSSNKEAVSRKNRLDKVRPKELMLNLTILGAPDLKLERSESATIPMRKNSAERKLSKRKAYQLTPTQSLKNMDEGKDAGEPLTSLNDYFSKRKISEEQIVSQSSSSSKGSKKPSNNSSQMSCEEAKDLVSPMIANKFCSQFEESQISFTTPQPVNHKNMVGNPTKKQLQIQETGSLEHSGFFSPDSKDDAKFNLKINARELKNESGFLESAEKNSKRRASQMTTLGRRNVPSCVLCCNSLHPIFEQLREKEEENQAFR